MNDRITDFVECSKYAFSETFSKIKKSYVLILFLILQSVFESTKSTGFLGNSFFAGIILYLVDVVIYCFIAQSLRSIVMYGNSGKKSMDSSLGNFFYLVLSAMFSIYIVNLFVSLLFRGLSAEVILIISIIIKFLLSAVLEFVYIQRYYGYDIVIQSAKFVVNNLLIWGVYSLVYVIIQSLLINKLGVYQSPSFVEGLDVILLTLLNCFFMLFKGHLFKYLTSHSYRQRKFMRG